MFGREKVVREGLETWRISLREAEALAKQKFAWHICQERSEHPQPHQAEGGGQGADRGRRGHGRA